MASGSGWNLWVWLVDVVVMRYISLLLKVLFSFLFWYFCVINFYVIIFSRSIIPANRPTFGGTVPLSRVVSHCPAKRTLIPRPATTPCGRGGEVEFTHARNVNNAHQLELSSSLSTPSL